MKWIMGEISGGKSISEKYSMYQKRLKIGINFFGEKPLLLVCHLHVFL